MKLVEEESVDASIVRRTSIGEIGGGILVEVRIGQTVVTIPYSLGCTRKKSLVEPVDLGTSCFT